MSGQLSWLDLTIAHKQNASPGCLAAR